MPDKPSRQHRRRSDYDVVIAGASLAGCATAIALGRAGASVALVEKRPDPAPSSAPARTSSRPRRCPRWNASTCSNRSSRRAALRTRMRAWTPWGWIEAAARAAPRRRSTCGASCSTRCVRETAAATPGVELMLGCSARRGCSARTARSRGLVARDRDGEETELRARPRRRRRRPRLAHRRAGRR